MPLYQCYILEDDGTSAAAISFESCNNSEAQGYTLRLFDEHPRANKIELWSGTKLTMSYAREGVHTPEELRALCARVLDAAHDETDPAIKRTIASYALWLAEEAEALEWRASH